MAMMPGMMKSTPAMMPPSVRCITAIWPAGPPKLSSATRVHTRNASPRETPCAGLAADLVVAVGSVGKVQLCALAGALAGQFRTGRRIAVPDEGGLFGECPSMRNLLD